MTVGRKTLGVALGWAGAVGCSTNDVGDFCDRSCECAACSDAERAECVDQSTRVRDEAASLGCGDEIDEFVDCLTDEAVCEGGDLRSGPDEECRAEQEAVEPCLCIDVGGTPSKLRYCLVD